MKKILLCLYFLTFIQNPSFSQWTSILPTLNIDGFSKISGLQFFNADYGFVILGNILIRTKNGGKTWEPINGISGVHKMFFTDQYTGFLASRNTLYKINVGFSKVNSLVTSDYIVDIFFIDQNTGFVLTYSSTYKTTDGGNNWSKSSSPKGSKIIFFDQLTGFLIDPPYLHKTTDGGENWNFARFTNDVNTAFFLNKDTGYLAGDYGCISKTTDQGETWENYKIVSKYPASLNSLFFIDDQTGFAGSFDKLYKTTDGGKNWTISGELKASEYIYFTDSETGYVASDIFGSVLKTTDGGVNWYDTDSSFHGKDFQSICHNGKNTMYVAGTLGTILRSDDGFKHWEKLNTGTLLDIFYLQFTDEKTGYALTWENVYGKLESTIIKTTDSGTSWNKINYNSSNPILHFCFTSSDTAFGVSEKNLYKSTDGCFNWSEVNLPSAYDIGLPYFINKNVGYVNAASKIYKTTDAGVNWFATEFSNNQISLSKIYFINHYLGFAIGYPGIILRTTDAGESWNFVWEDLKVTNYPAPFCTIHFTSDLVGYVAGDERIMKTIDGGITWHYIQGAKSIQYVRSIYFLNQNEGYACGNGYLMKTTNGGGAFLTDVDEKIFSQQDNFEILQNYPNPFNPVTTINYSIPVQSFVELKVYDMLGREVSTLISKEQSAGKYNAQFDGTFLPSGVYVYSLRAGRYSSSKKLTLLK